MSRALAMSVVGDTILDLLLSFVSWPLGRARPGARRRRGRGRSTSRRGNRRPRRKAVGLLERFRGWAGLEPEGIVDDSPAKPARRPQARRPSPIEPPAPGPAAPRPEDEASPVPVSELALTFGRRVDVAGAAEGEPIEAPVSGEACVGWWCGVRSGGRARDLRTVSRGAFRVRDESGSVAIEAASARPHALPRARATVRSDGWARQERGESLLAVARSAGFERPERERKLVFVEERLEAGERLVARGYPTAAPGAGLAAGYRARVEVELRLEPGPAGPVLVSGSGGFPKEAARGGRSRGSRRRAKG